MKALIIFKGPYPYGNVTTQRVHYICKGLTENNINVEILIPIRTESAENIKNKHRSGIYDGVNFKYVPASTIRKNNLVIRQIDKIYSYLKTFIIILVNKRKADLITIIGPSMDFRIFIPFLCKFAKLKCIIEINELPFVNNKPKILKSIKSFIFKKLILSKYDGIIVISNKLQSFAEKYKACKTKIIKVPILGAIEKFDELRRPPIETPYIIHTGSLIENKDGIKGIIEAFKIALNKLNTPLKFVITGADKNNHKTFEIKELIKQYNLEDDVIFTGYLDRKELIRYLRFANLAIINKQNNMQNLYCFPTKLADYFFNKVPVIITRIGEASSYLTNGLNAYIIETSEPTKIAEKIVYALQNNDERIHIGNEGFMLASKEFNYKTHGKRIANFFSEIINN